MNGLLEYLKAFSLRRPWFDADLLDLPLYSDEHCGPALFEEQLKKSS